MSELNVKAELTSIKPTGYVVADITLDYTKGNVASVAKKISTLPSKISISENAVKHLNNEDKKLATQAVINVGTEFSRKGADLKQIVTDMLVAAFGDVASVDVKDVYAYVDLDITDGSLDIQKLQRHIHHNPKTNVTLSVGKNKKPTFIIPASSAKSVEDFMNEAYQVLADKYTSTGNYESIDLSGDAQRAINDYRKATTPVNSPSYTRESPNYAKYGDENMKEGMRSAVQTHSRGMYGWTNYLFKAISSLSNLKKDIADMEDKDVKNFSIKLRSDILADEPGARRKDDDNNPVKEDNGILYDLRNAITGCHKTQAQEAKIRNEYLDHFLGIGKYESKEDTKPFYTLVQNEIDQINDDMRVMRSLKRYAQKEEYAGGDSVTLKRSEIYEALIDQLVTKRKLLEKELTQASKAIDAVKKAKQKYEVSSHKAEDKEAYLNELAAIKASIPNPAIESIIPTGYQFSNIVKQLKDSVDTAFAEKNQEEANFMNGVVHTKDSEGKDLDIKYTDIEDNLRDKTEKYSSLTSQYYDKINQTLEELNEKHPKEEDRLYAKLIADRNHKKDVMEASEKIMKNDSYKNSTDPKIQKAFKTAYKRYTNAKNDYFRLVNSAIPKAEEEWRNAQQSAAYKAVNDAKFSDTSDLTWSQVLDAAKAEVDRATEARETMRTQQETERSEKDEAFKRQDLMYRNTSDLSDKTSNVSKELEAAKKELEDLQNKQEAIKAGTVKDHTGEIVNSVTTSLGSKEQQDFNSRRGEALSTAPLSRDVFARRWAIHELGDELKGVNRGTAERLIHEKIYSDFSGKKVEGMQPDMSDKILKAYRWYALYEYAKNNQGKLPYIKTPEDAARFALNAYAIDEASRKLSSEREAKIIRGHLEDYFGSKLNASNRKYLDPAADSVLIILYNTLRDAYHVNVELPEKVLRSSSVVRESAPVQNLIEDARGANFMHAAFMNAVRDSISDVVSSQEDVESTEEERKSIADKIQQAEKNVEDLTAKLEDYNKNKEFLDSTYTKFEGKAKPSYVFDVDTEDGALSSDDIKSFLDRVVASSKDMGDGMSHVPLDTRKWLKEMLQSFVAENKNLSADSKKNLDTTIDNGLINDYTSRVVSEGAKTYNSRTPVDLSERSSKEQATSAMADLMESIANGKLPKQSVLALANARGSVDEFIKVLHEQAVEIHDLRTKADEEEGLRDDEFRTKYNTSYSKSDLQEHSDTWSETLADLEKTLDLARNKMKMNITPAGLMALLKDPEKGAEVFEKAEEEEKKDTLSSDTRTAYYSDLYSKFTLLMGYETNEAEFKRELKENFMPEFKKAIIKSKTTVNRNEKADRQKILTEMYNKIQDTLQGFNTNAPVDEEVEHPNENEKVIPTFEDAKFKGNEDNPEGAPTGEKAVENKSVFEGKTPKEEQ